MKRFIYSLSAGLAAATIVGAAASGQALAASGHHGHVHGALSINVAAHPSSLLANGTATSMVVVRLQHGKSRANASVSLTDAASTSGSCGTLSASSGSTGRSGRFVVTYTSSSTVGFCTITATSGSLSGSVTLDQIDPTLAASGTHYALSVSATPSRVKSDGTSTSQVKVVVTNGSNPVAGDAVFATTRSLQAGACGSLSAAGSTDSTGTYSFTYTAGTAKGNCLLRVIEAATGASGVIVIHQSSH